MEIELDVPEPAGIFHDEKTESPKRPGMEIVLFIHVKCSTVFYSKKIIRYLKSQQSKRNLHFLTSKTKFLKIILH